MSKKALITGVTGQDGSYLVEFLLNKGYEVCGFIRRVFSHLYNHMLISALNFDSKLKSLNLFIFLK